MTQTQSPSKILIVEDEAPIRTLISFACAGAGFDVQSCDSVMAAQELMDSQLPDLILLDYMLPETSGVEWLEQLRSNEQTQHLPVIMLTARGSESDRVKGLNAARIQAVMRRYHIHSEHAPMTQNTLIKCGPLTMDEASYKAEVNGEPISLSAKEFKLLSVFAKNPERVYSREMLLNLVWDNAYVDERTVDVHMLRLRKQLQGTAAENLLQTVRGLGYRAHLENI